MANNMFKCDGIIYKYGAGMLEVCGFADKKDKRVELKIPETLTVVYAGKQFAAPVTEIKNEAFNNAINLIHVYIPKTVNRIGDRAFANCINLRDVYSKEHAPNIHISTGAFSGCLNLTTVEMARTEATLSSEAFADCFGLETITMPLKRINNYAFKNCSNLTKIQLADDAIIHNNTVENTSIKEMHFFDEFESISNGALKWIKSHGVAMFCPHFSNICSLAYDGFNVNIQLF